MKSDSESPRTNTRLWVRTGFGRDPRHQQARKVTEGQLVVSGRCHDERVGAVDALVLKPVSGVGARQAAQRHHPRHEPAIWGRFAGPDKSVYLVGQGERSAAPGAKRRGSPATACPGRREPSPIGNKLAALTLHGFILPCSPDKTGTPLQTNDLSSFIVLFRWSGRVHFYLAPRPGLLRADSGGATFMRGKKKGFGPRG